MRLKTCVLFGCLSFCLPAYLQAAPATPAAVNQQYVITLISSFEPIADSLVPNDLKNLTVYRIQSTVFGKQIYFVRAGFFASEADANAAKERLAGRYPGAFVTQANPDEISTAAKPASAPPVPAPAPTSSAPVPSLPPAPATSSPAEARTTLYAITLVTKTTGSVAPVAALPAELSTQRLYTQALRTGGKTVRTLNLGFFNSAAEAEEARGLLNKTYPNARVRTATNEEREASAQTTVAFVAPKASSVTSPTPPPVAPASKPADGNPVEQKAAELMAKARAALERKDNDGAVLALDQLLKLPPNKQSQEAQELVGLARERLNQIALARQEYNLYLKLYPKGEGADRVRQRLANIESIAPKRQLKAVKPRDIAVTSIFGNVSQYYYRGSSQIDTTSVPTVGPTIVSPTLNSTDQSSLISTLSLTGRMRSGEWDDRIVIRDTYNANFLDSAGFASTNVPNRLYDAYAEIHNRISDYGGRLGRQPGTPGLLGRFDGLTLNYAVQPKWRLNLSLGKPVEFYPIDSQKSFWSAYLGYGTFAEHWSGNLYYVQQTVDGIIDRQALGNELRYFHPKGSAFLLLDYDLYFSELNTAMLQANWLATSSTNFNLLVDHRRAPALSTSNALIGSANTSISSQLLTFSESELRAMALDQTPIADTYLFGGSHNFNPTWQMSGSVTLFQISGTAPNTLSQGISATGQTSVYNLQGIMLTRKRDATVLSLNYLTGPTNDGKVITLSNHTSLSERWLLDTALSYYTGETTSTVLSDTNRITPRLRLAYRWRTNVTFEAEASLEKTTSHTTTTNTTTNITTTDTQVTDYHYYSVGYRWDF